MRLLIAGGSGFLGTALAQASESHGDEVRRLVRQKPTSAAEFEWHPEAGSIDPAALDGVDGVVCLSGAGVGDHRWTADYRRTILTSRTASVTTLARAIAAASTPPTVFVSASAVGYYGDRGAELLDETASGGVGFFPDVCRAWEAAALAAASARTRIVQLRTGIVLARQGEVLARMLPLFKLGVGGRLGSGEQYWSWITLTDHVDAMRFVLTATDLDGPVNLTAPGPVTNAEFTRTLARVIHRPAVLPVPGFALHIALGGLAGEIITGQRVVPAKLTSSGFVFTHSSLEAGLRAELA